MNKMIQVLLANDFPLMRAGIRAILTAEEDLTLVGEATDGCEVQRLCQELQPDVLLLDLYIPGPSPFETVTFLRKHFPAIKVLALTTHDDDFHIKRLIATGVTGCVLKDEATEAIIRAIRSVAQGDTWFSRRIMVKLCQVKTNEVDQPKIPGLTDRELEVLQLVVQGCTNNHIAAALVISERTVRFHLRNLYDKLKVNTRSELMIWAIREGLG